MAFTSFSFIALALLFVLLTQAFPSRRARSVSLALASAVFVASYVESWRELLPFGAFLLFGYLGIEVLRRTRSAAGLSVSILLTLGAFVVLKHYSFLGDAARLPFPYLVVGLSYVLFRLLHLMVDAQQGELERRIPGLDFLNYCISFLSFTAGPIQLYPDFERAQAAAPPQDREQVGQASSRIVKGFVKVAVASAILNYAFVALSARLLAPELAEGRALPLFGVSALLYTAYLYANFSGYMDIVIGVGALAGYHLPENFDQPFRARSFLELWTRWHLTLSNWFKIYLFNPLLKGLAKRYSSSGSAPHLATFAFFVTFLVMGLWHGSTTVFLVYGLLLAVGASVNKWWQVLVSARLGKKVYKQWCERTPIIYASRGLTTAYFALALTCLWVDMQQLRLLLERLGPFGVVAAYLGVASIAAVAFLASDTLFDRLSRLRARMSGALAHPWTRDFSLAAQILLILSVGSFFHKAPEFVYRAF